MTYTKSAVICPSCGSRLNPQMYPCFENHCPVRVPEVWKDCEICGGEGGFEKHSHDDSMWETCKSCDGKGGFINEAEGE